MMRALRHCSEDRGALPTVAGLAVGAHAYAGRPGASTTTTTPSNRPSAATGTPSRATPFTAGSLRLVPWGTPGRTGERRCPFDHHPEFRDHPGVSGNLGITR